MVEAAAHRLTELRGLPSITRTISLQARRRCAALEPEGRARQTHSYPACVNSAIRTHTVNFYIGLLRPQLPNRGSFECPASPAGTLWKQLVKVAEVQEDQQARPEISSNDGLLSLNDLAQYLSCSRSYAAMLIAEGTIPSFKLGTLRRIRKSDVDAYVERQLSKSEG